MHLTRPKSSKGRSRPAADGGADGPRGTPPSPAPSEPDAALRSQSQPVMWRAQAALPSGDEALHTPRRAPAARPPSLNKYRVLPCIERRRSEVGPGGDLVKAVSGLTLSGEGGANLQHRCEEPGLHTAKTSTCTSGRSEGAERIRPEPSDPGPATAAGPLLLAIRAPCGRRFQQHFQPTDTLQMVRASAEARYGSRYEEASIETAEVPRRTFTDMDMSLAQCGVVNRSVLCITQNQDSS